MSYSEKLKLTKLGKKLNLTKWHLFSGFILLKLNGYECAEKYLITCSKLNR